MLSRDEINSWIENGPTNDLVGRVEEFGGEIQRGKLTTSQIRQVFTKVKAIEAKGIISKSGERRTGELVMLKPLLAYAAVRDKKNSDGIKGLKTVLTMGIEYVLAATTDEEVTKRYKNFCKLFEATLAYYRAADGDSN